MCGMTNVLPPTRFKVGSEEVALQLAEREQPTDRFALAVRAFAVDRGRLCLDCGHVALVMPEAQLAELRDRLGRLTPYP